MTEKEHYTFGSFARELREDIAAYVDARIEYTKFSAYEKSARLISGATTVILIGLLSFFAILFLSFTLALILGNWLGNPVWGYGLVTLLDILGVVIIVSRKSVIEERITQKVVERLLEENEEIPPTDETA
ncbi:MAG: phage holin family protein [Bacteroidia bacterium]